MFETILIGVGIISAYIIFFLVLCNLTYSISFNIAKGWYTGKKEAQNIIKSK